MSDSGSAGDPAFSSAVLSLLDRGFVYAVAQVRGGQELGRRWYDSGRLLQKQNSFTDFIDVTRFLVRGGYADPARVFARGFFPDAFLPARLRQPGGPAQPPCALPNESLSPVRRTQLHVDPPPAHGHATRRCYGPSCPSAPKPKPMLASSRKSASIARIISGRSSP